MLSKAIICVSARYMLGDHGLRVTFSLVRRIGFPSLTYTVGCASFKALIVQFQSRNKKIR